MESQQTDKIESKYEEADTGNIKAPLIGDPILYPILYT